MYVTERSSNILYSIKVTPSIFCYTLISLNNDTCICKFKILQWHRHDHPHFTGHYWQRKLKPPRCVQLIVCGQVFVINAIKLTSFIYIIIIQENVCDSSNMGVIINKIVQTHTTPGLTRRQSTGTFKCNAILWMLIWNIDGSSFMCKVGQDHPLT